MECMPCPAPYIKSIWFSPVAANTLEQFVVGKVDPVVIARLPRIRNVIVHLVLKIAIIWDNNALEYKCKMNFFYQSPKLKIGVTSMCSHENVKPDGSFGHIPSDLD